MSETIIDFFTWLSGFVVMLFLVIIPMWKLFVKANKPGWASIIPIYNTIVMIQIAGRPVWWIILFFIPIVNFVILIIITENFVRAFGKNAGFVVGVIFLPMIFIPLLGYSDVKYMGVNTSAAPVAPQSNPTEPTQTSNPDQPQTPPTV